MYRDFFDIHIENSTLVVAIISMLIMLVGVYVPNDGKLYTKANILESQTLDFSGKVVVIDGIEYKLIMK